MNVYQILTDSAQLFAQKPAIIFKDKIISFADLKANVLALARGLQSLGVGNGKKIALYLPNCPEYVYSYLSSFLLGAVVIPLDYMLKDRRVDRLFISCRGRLCDCFAEAGNRLGWYTKEHSFFKDRYSFRAGF